jgi:hypothetical protein
MYRNRAIPIAIAALLALGPLVGGCGSTNTKGRVSSLGGLGSAGDACHYQSARSQALALLDKASAVRASNPVRAAQFEQRASAIISRAESCQGRR